MAQPCMRPLSGPRFRPLFRHLSIAGLLLLALGAKAQVCVIPGADQPQADYQATMQRLKLRDCLGDPKADRSDIVVRFNSLTNAPTNLGQTQRVQAAVDALSEHAEQRAAANPQKSTWTLMAQELRQMRLQLDPLNDTARGTAWLAIVERAVPPKWRQVSAGAGAVALAGTAVTLTDTASCVDGQPCEDFAGQLDLVRVANLVERLRGYTQSGSLAAQYEESQLALKQWEAYRAKAHHQYIWELWFNGSRMGKDLCPEDAGSGMKMGFCKVPTSQWILLHPEAALRFSRSADKASDLQAALIVELVGHYAWRWKTEGRKESAEMVDRRGYSLAASYTQSSIEKRWGFGPMVHFDDFSLALTKARGGRWSLVVNVALAERYFGRKQEAVDELRKVKKAGLGELLFGP